ncbi:MAG: hypothetical protein U0794_20395 [Isosphaeraceae bacterium]
MAAVETSLHRALKERHGLASGVGGPALCLGRAGIASMLAAPDGTLIEVQSGALGPLRGKLALLPAQSIRVVKPVTPARRVVRRSRRDGGDPSSRAVRSGGNSWMCSTTWSDWSASFPIRT